MPTTADYLRDLTRLRGELAERISEGGIAASPDEKYNTLVPKVSRLCNNLTHHYLSADAVADESGGVTIANRGNSVEDSMTFLSATIDSSGDVVIAGTAESYGAVVRSGDSYGRRGTVYILMRLHGSPVTWGRILAMGKTTANNYAPGITVNTSGIFAVDRMGSSVATDAAAEDYCKYAVYTLTADQAEGNCGVYIDGGHNAVCGSLGDFGRTVSVGIIYADNGATSSPCSARISFRAMRVYDTLHGADKIKETAYEMVRESFPEAPVGAAVTAEFSGHPGDKAAVTVYTPDDVNIAVAAEGLADCIESTELTAGFNELTLGVLSGGAASATLTAASELLLVETAAKGVFDQYSFVAAAAETIFTYGDRTVVKSTADKAYVAYCHLGGWFAPVVVSRTVEGTRYTMYGTTTDAENPESATDGGSIEYGGFTWYYNLSSPGSYQGAHDSGHNRYYMGSCSATAEDIAALAQELLVICMRDWAV